MTLTGVGGVGKTRLALQVAAEVLPRFADGAWLCELAAVRDPAGVVDAVAGVFQVTARPGMSLEESLVAYLGDQELLIVLDNCEHLLGPVAALVRAIEGACARVRVLATSREGLGVRGEQIIGGAVAGGARQHGRSRSSECVRGGAPLRGPGPGREGQFRGRCRQRRRGRAGVSTARWRAVGDRAGGGAHHHDEPGRAGASAGPTVPAAHRRRPRRDRTSPDVAGHDRLVL